MLDIKMCRKIKKDCTKQYSGKNMIFKLDEYPFVYLIITHGDSKSWGYFFNGKDCLFLGRSNQEMCNIQFEFRDFRISQSYEKIVIHSNPEVQRVYKQFSDHLIKARSYWNTPREFRVMNRINPVLFTNLVDCNCFKGFRYCSNGSFDFIDNTSNYFNRFDFTKNLIKDAFHLPPSWLRIVFSRWSTDFDRLNHLKSHGYTPNEVMESMIGYGSDLFSIPEAYLSNKPVAKLWCENYRYRDYLNMRNELPTEVKKGFPLCPSKDKIIYWHDKITPVYNRNKILMREKELAEKQRKYEEGTYKEAVKYEYSNNNYSIIAAKKLIDLLLEGNSLHHCVGSYIDSVYNGREYILFLRKNSDLETSYFTIDLTPEKQVRQIHGLRNCNMDSEIEPFIKEWAKKFKLTLAGCSGVKCAL